MKLFFFLFLPWILGVPEAGAACSEASPAASAKWNDPAVELTAGVSKGAAPSIPFDTKILLTLAPQPQVALALKPAKAGAKAEKAFAGLVKVNPVNAGLYEVALGDHARVEIVDAGTGASLKSGQPKKSTVVTAATKTIYFPLEAGRLYFFQVTSSRSGSLALLVHPSGP